MTTPNLSLPYSFDTTKNGRMALLSLWGAVPVLLVSYFMIEAFGELGGDILMMLRVLLPVIAVIDVISGYWLYRKGQGATGTISAHMVQVTADRFLGLHSSAPEGTFTLQQFEGIGLSLTSVKGNKLGHVSLIGKDKAHTIKLISTAPDKAEALAAFLSRELNLARIA